MHIELIKIIEWALDIKFLNWQIEYLQGSTYSEEIMHKRRCGKTLVHIIRLFDDDDTLLDLSNLENILEVMDYPLTMTDPIRYVQWLKSYLWKIHTKLSNHNVYTRPIKWR